MTIDVVGITTNWERRMRSTKRGIIRAMGGKAPDFTCVWVSEDIADAIREDTMILSPIGDDTTYELIPLKVDIELPVDTVIFLWKEAL